MMREGYSCTLLDSFLACLQLPALHRTAERALILRYICCGINLPRRRIRTYSRRQNKHFKILQDPKLFRCARLKQYDAKFPYETLSEPLNE